MLFINDETACSVLNGRNIGDILRDDTFKKKLEEYEIIQKEYKKSKPLVENELFKNRYSFLFNIDLKHRDAFFRTLDTVKNKKYKNDNELVDDIFDLLEAEGISESESDQDIYVYAFKILHTIVNKYPIIDTQIENLFKKVGIEVSRKEYTDFCNKIIDYLESNEAETKLIKYSYTSVYPEMTSIRKDDMLMIELLLKELNTYRLASSLIMQDTDTNSLYFYLLEMLCEANKEIYVPYKNGNMYYETIKREGFDLRPIDQDKKVPLNKEGYYRMYIFYIDILDKYNKSFDLTLDYKKTKFIDFINQVIKDAPASQISFNGYYNCCYNTDAVIDIWSYCFDPKVENYHDHFKIIKKPI